MLFQRCVESLERYPPSVSHEIIVVDNASTDDSLLWLRSRSGRAVRVIENRENAGFAKANNQAFLDLAAQSGRLDPHSL